jgi:endoglucanase
LGTLPFMLRKSLILLALAMALLPAAATAADTRGVSPSDPNPLAGVTFWNDPNSPSMQSWRFLQHQGQHAKADLIWKIASQPKALWLGRFTRPNFAVKVRRLIDPARERGEVPIFTVLRAEATGCSPTYQGGGPAEDRRTMDWYDDLARVIGNDRVVIAFEPDSLGTIDCLAPSRRDDRYRVLAHGVDALSKLPNATVYIEAGASDWESAARTAKQLRIVGVRKVRGFMLNVTHYDWTRSNIQHGLDISRRLGGKHFIINTAENGRGGVHYKKWIDRSRHIWRRITVWCNPGLRGLGPAPTTQTSRPDRVDAYLWINRPGFAQSCQGRPIAWYLPRALTLTKYATDWENAPPGTRFGFKQHYPLSKFLNE